MSRQGRQYLNGFRLNIAQVQFANAHDLQMIRMSCWRFMMCMTRYFATIMKQFTPIVQRVCTQLRDILLSCEAVRIVNCKGAATTSKGPAPISAFDVSLPSEFEDSNTSISSYSDFQHDNQRTGCIPIRDRCSKTCHQYVMGHGFFACPAPALFIWSCRCS